MATTPEFLVLPGTTDAWISFVSDEPEAAFAQINQQIAELAQVNQNTSPQFPPVPSDGQSAMQGIETTDTADNLPGGMQ